jgi:nucleoside-diphosphate-sugar epimerase
VFVGEERMRVLVTGGAGYVGSELVPPLLAEGHHVRVVDNLRRGGQALLHCCTNPRFEMVARDIGDDDAMATALDGIDVVVHLAAIVGQAACQREPACAWSTNVAGTRSLLALRRPDQRLLFASTGSVYGSVQEPICTEATSVRPLTLYARSKAAGEQLVLEAGNCIVFRFATGFGVSRSMRLDLLVNDFVYRAVHQGSLMVYQGGALRSLIHVRDMARCILFALREWPSLADDVYNVGTETLSLTKAEVVDCIRNRIDCHVHFADFARDADQRDYAVSYQKIGAKGFSTEVGLEVGVSELVRAAALIA